MPINSKNECLILCSRPISNRATQAGDRCAYEFIRKLCSQYDIELILLINSTDNISVGLAEDLGVKNLHVYRISRLEKLYLITVNLFKGIPPRYGSRLKNSILKDIQKKIASHQFSEIYYEFSQCASYHLYLPNHISSTLSIHDLQIQVSLRSKPIEAFLFTWPTYQYEKKLLTAINKLIVLCDKDKKLIEGLYQHKQTSIRPPPLSDFVTRVHRKIEHIERYSILFWGALARPENEEAAWLLIKQIFPPIKEIFPEAKLYIAGSEPSKRLLDMQSESVIVTGFIEKPESFFSSAHLGVLPLIRGAGIKLKTLEMLACKLPVITTEIGAEGVSDNELLTIVSLDKIVDSVINTFNQSME